MSGSPAVCITAGCSAWAPRACHRAIHAWRHDGAGILYKFHKATLAGLHQILTQSSMHSGGTRRGPYLLYMFQQGTLVGQRSVTQRSRASASRWSPLASAISARIMRSTSRLLLSSQRLHTGTGQVGLLKLGSQGHVGGQLQCLHGTSGAGVHLCVHAQHSRAGEPKAHS